MEFRNSARNAILILIGLTSCVGAKAQFKTAFIFDTIAKTSRLYSVTKDGEFIYTASVSNDRVNLQVVVRKVDTLGRVLWSTSKFDTIPGANDPIGTMPDNLTLVVSTGVPFLLVRDGVHCQLWKINPADGMVVYKKPFLVPNRDIRLSDFDANQLVAYYSPEYDGVNIHTYKLAHFDKNTGERTDSLTVTKLPNQFNTSSFAVAPGEGVFYTSRDTLFKLNFQDFTQKVWAVKIVMPGLTTKVVSEIIYDKQENALWAIVASQAPGGNVLIKIDVTTGALLWNYPFNAYPGFVKTLDFDDQYVYLLNYIYGPPPMANIVKKLAKNSGTKIWEVTNQYQTGSGFEQQTTDFTVRKGAIWLTGFVGPDATSSGKWGIIKMDVANGQTLFRTIYPPYFPVITEDQSRGERIVPLENCVICLGNAESEELNTGLTTVEVWLTLDANTGATVGKTILGGRYQHQSATTNLLVFDDGKVVALQHQARRMVVKQMDANGNVAWKKEFSSYFGFKNLYMSKVRGDTFLVAAVAVPDYNIFVNNFYSDNKLHLYLMRSNGAVLDTLIVNWSSGKTNLNSLLYDSEDSRYYCTYRDYNETNIGVFTFNAWLVGSGGGIDLGWNPGIQGAQTMWKPENSPYLYAFGGQIHRYAVGLNGNWEWFFEQGIGSYNHVENRNNTLLVCGQSSDVQPKAIIALLDKATLSSIWQKKLETGLNSASCRYFVQGESNNIIYLLIVSPQQSKLLKFNLNNQTVLWSKTVFQLPSGQYKINALVYNGKSGMVTLCGSRNSTGLESQLFIQQFYGANGDKLADYVMDGDLEENDNAITVLDIPATPVTMVGGSLNDEQRGGRTGFLYFFDDDVSNALKAQVFWDVNENGLYDPPDKTLQLGSLLLNQTTQLYFNDQGYLSVVTTPGIHQLDFQIPPGWLLTTGTTSFQVNTLLPPTNTQYIGLEPGNGQAVLNPFVIGQHFVCDDTARLFLDIRNLGLNPASFSAVLEYDGEFLSASVPPDGASAGALSWVVADVLPGAKWTNQLGIKMPDAGALGEPLHFRLSCIFPSWNQPGVIDTVRFTYQEVLNCAYDPNDKTVAPTGEGTNGITNINEWLSYTIRFQNTGNFPARNIVIRDTLDGNFDMESFQFMGASHPVTSIERTGKALQFVFRDIYLPDSAASQEHSRGYLSFRVKPQTGLPELSTVRNTAHIYFDFNDPIATNTVLNTLTHNIVPTTELPDPSLFTIRPNPVHDRLHVNLEGIIEKDVVLECSNGNGNILKRYPIQDDQRSIIINVADWPNGIYWITARQNTKRLHTDCFIKL